MAQLGNMLAEEDEGTGESHRSSSRFLITGLPQGDLRADAKE
jgi:hypothetical protein